MDTPIWKRVVQSLRELRWATLGIIVVNILFFLALPRPLAYTFAVVGVLIVFANALNLRRAGYFARSGWNPAAALRPGFSNWRSNFIIQDMDNNTIDRNDLIIASQDPKLTYLVFHPIQPKQYRIRVAFALPRFHDRALYILSLFVWALIYVTLATFLGPSLVEAWRPEAVSRLQSISDFFPATLVASPALLQIYGDQLKIIFPTAVSFLTSFLLPMLAVGVSMSITSLIHFVNRTPPERFLLRNLVTLVVFLMAGASFLLTLVPALS